MAGTDMSHEMTVVVGASGKTGRRVMQRLQARGVPARGASRSGDVPFDWDDRSTWAPALRGATAGYVSFFPDLAVPGAPEAIAALAQDALASDVRRLVLLSGRGEEEAQRAEQVLQQAGIEWTVVRCSWFSQNFSEGYLLEPVRAGEVVLPVGDVPEPFVDVDDIADVAVAALIEDGHAGHIYELTGPRLLTFADAVEEIARATGRPIAYVPVSMEDYVAAAVEDDVPDDVVWLLRYLFTEVLDGRNAHVNDGVQRALGREPRDFADFARDAAARGAWDARR
jgi:uncharacterized protein YbjT (DUF2867 family)